MFMRHENLCHYPEIFRSMTGLTVSEFDQLTMEITPLYTAIAQKRLRRQDRLRAPGAGHPFSLDFQDSLLLTLIYLWQHPVGEALGYFFGVSEPTVRRTVARILPALRAAGRATSRWAGQKRGRSLAVILDGCPEVAEVIEAFEKES